MKTGAPPGERHGNSKLTDVKVREMRRRYREGGISILALAVDYDIAYSTCRAALKGEGWKHIDLPIRTCTHCHGKGVEPE